MLYIRSDGYKVTWDELMDWHKKLRIHRWGRVYGKIDFVYISKNSVFVQRPCIDGGFRYKWYSMDKISNSSLVRIQKVIRGWNIRSDGVSVIARRVVTAEDQYMDVYEWFLDRERGYDYS